MNDLPLKFTPDEREELNEWMEYVAYVEGDYWIEGTLSEAARALVRLGLVEYV